MTERDMLPTLCQWFEDAEMATADARQKAERDRDYYDGKQLTAEERSALAQRKQPAIVENLVRRKVDYLSGLEKQSRQDPKAYPRTPHEEGVAEAATDAIRFVVDEQRFPQTASKAWENRIVDGACGVDVCVEPGGPFGFRVRVKRVPWDRMFWDPHSAEEDFSDAKYLGMVTWMDEEDVLALWPDAKEAIAGSYAGVSHSDTYDDRPKHGVWGDGKRKRVRVAQVYWNGPEGWQYAAYTKGGFLDEAQPSPYEDEDGKPTCPLVFGSGYVDRDNNRYGAVRDLIDMQDEVNKRRSKALHLLSVRQLIAEAGAFEDEDKARREFAKPDGFIIKNHGFHAEIVPTADMAAGQWQLLADARNAMAGMGPNASMQGKQGGSASGRAIALSQQGGLIEVGMLLDAHRDWKRRVYQAIWERIRQFWTAEIWLRVTDDEQKLRFVGLNVPEVVGMDPMGQPVVEVQNEVARTAVDIVVDEAPDVITLQSEQQQILGDLLRAAPQFMPALIEPFLRTTNLRNKDKIIEGVTQMMQAPQAPNPAMLEVERKAKKDEGDFALDRARLQLDAAKAQQDALARMTQPVPMLLA